MLNNLQRLISWLEDIQNGKEPEIPYNLHALIRCLHDGLGTHEAIKMLKQLDRYNGDE